MLSILRSELRRSVKIIKGGNEIVPRFRIFTHDGDYIVFNPLPDDIKIRHERMALVRRFMVWKLATGFILSTETMQPDAVTAVAVWRDGGSDEIKVLGLYQLITRNGSAKPSFAPEERAGKEMAGDVLELLPRHQESLSQDEIDELQTLMGNDGFFVVEKIK